MYKYNMDQLYGITLESLEKKGVALEDIAKIVYDLQKDYIDLNLEICLENVRAVLKKRETIHAVLTALAIDEVVDKKLFPEPIQSIIEEDEGLYGIDEILSLAIVNIYGSIGLTNFGYLDKKKVGIIDELDKKKGKEVTTFTDDMVAAIAAAAASRLAHQNLDFEQKPKKEKEGRE